MRRKPRVRTPRSIFSPAVSRKRMRLHPTSSIMQNANTCAYTRCSAPPVIIMGGRGRGGGIVRLLQAAQVTVVFKRSFGYKETEQVGPSVWLVTRRSIRSTHPFFPRSTYFLTPILGFNLQISEAIEMRGSESWGFA